MARGVFLVRAAADKARRFTAKGAEVSSLACSDGEQVYEIHAAVNGASSAWDGVGFGDFVLVEGDLRVYERRTWIVATRVRVVEEMSLGAVFEAAVGD